MTRDTISSLARDCIIICDAEVKRTSFNKLVTTSFFTNGQSLADYTANKMRWAVLHRFVPESDIGRVIRHLCSNALLRLYKYFPQIDNLKEYLERDGDSELEVKKTILGYYNAIINSIGKEWVAKGYKYIDGYDPSIHVAIDEIVETNREIYVPIVINENEISKDLEIDEALKLISKYLTAEQALILRLEAKNEYDKGKINLEIAEDIASAEGLTSNMKITPRKIAKQRYIIRKKCREIMRDYSGEK